ncbi:hypothetical protein [Actinomadura napierensis]|uniref:Transposase n=1 Tax=Actinomadura napierensis TaxID=267854 RepID=A0ABP5M6J1_9ACTN
MSGRVRSEDKVVRLAMPRVRSNGRRPSRLTEQERQVLLSELAEVTAELNELQARTMEIAARVINTTPTQHVRPA